MLKREEVSKSKVLEIGRTGYRREKQVFRRKKQGLGREPGKRRGYVEANTTLRIKQEHPLSLEKNQDVRSKS